MHASVVCFSPCPQRTCHRRAGHAHTIPKQARTLVISPAKITNRFDESADQVKKLLDRDRKEVQEFGDIGGAFKAEFDEGNDEPSPSSSTPPAAAASTSKPAASASAPTSFAAKPASPFGAATPAASPFGSAPTASPFGAPRKSLMEPEGLSPNMPAMPVTKEPWWKKITLTQVLIVLSFTLIIVSMLATFFVVLKSGGVRFNED